MRSKSGLYLHKGIFFIILLLGMPLSLFYIQGCTKQESKTEITIVDEYNLPIHFDDIEEPCINTLSFGNKIYRVSNSEERAQVRFGIVTFLDGEINTVFESDLLNTAEKGSYFNISINDGLLCVFQFGDESPKRVVAYNLNDIPVKSYKTSAFSWLNNDAEADGKIACFQFYGSMTDTLSTIDANQLKPSDLTDASIDGFAVTIETVKKRCPD